MVCAVSVALAEKARATIYFAVTCKTKCLPRLPCCAAGGRHGLRKPALPRPTPLCLLRALRVLCLQMWEVVRGDLSQVQAAAMDAYWQLLSGSLADPGVRLGFS
jgi:hypothetical protein